MGYGDQLQLNRDDGDDMEVWKSWDTAQWRVAFCIVFALKNNFLTPRSTMAETRHHENVEVEEIVEAALRDVKSTSQLKAFLQKLQETMKEEAKSDYKAIIEL